MVKLEALLKFIEEAEKANWSKHAILAQIELFARGYRDVRLSDLCIILIDGFVAETTVSQTIGWAGRKTQ